MRKKYDGTISDRLNWMQVALNNTLETPAILTAMSRFGYDGTRIQVGLDLLEVGLESHAAYNQARGKQLAATEAYQTAWDEADAKHFMIHRELVKIAFSSDTERRQA